MKKILLSISMLAAVMTANAQTFMLYNPNTGDSPFNGTAFIFQGCANPFTVDTADAAPKTITASGTAAAAAYYICGFGNARYNSNGDPEAIGYTASNFTNDKFFMNIFTNNEDMKVKIQFSTVTGTTIDTDIYGYEFDLTGAASKTNYADVSAKLSQFSKLDPNNNSSPDGVNFLTSSLAQKIAKIEIVVVKQGNTGTGAGSIALRHMFIGTSSVTGVQNQSAVANLSVSPNPTTDFAVVKYSAPTEAMVTVSDLKGNVVKTVKGSSTDATISTSDLTSGMYVITVAVDGVPSAPQKLVVK